MPARSTDARAAPNAGKALRPALALLCCRAAGGDIRQAVPVAVAVEVLHNASLIHDDIIDGDTLRRGRPALWHACGTPAAILAGDALLFLAMDTPAQAGGTLADHGLTRLIHAAQDLIAGEYLDTLLESRPHAALREAGGAAAAKTGSLIAASCALGALAAGADTTTISHLEAYGTHLGAAFQLTDDILGIRGDQGVTGKPACSDLRSRKKSLPVTAALTSHGADADRLRALYEKPEAFAEDQLPHIAGLVDRAGGRAWAQAEATRHTAAAHQRLMAASPEGEATADLHALATLITHRKN